MDFAYDAITAREERILAKVHELNRGLSLGIAKAICPATGGRQAGESEPQAI